MNKKDKGVCLNESCDEFIKTKDQEEDNSFCISCGIENLNGFLCEHCLELESLESSEDFFDQDWCVNALIERDNQISSLKRQVNELAARLSKYEKVELEDTNKPTFVFSTIKKKVN
ncbi:hypothetical protein [Ureaplasma diversum]|uniref:Uncharacterized protein n=1 Tax=Ureaplasma diversum NCTC 246 TaxID=1188241 RepID=A0A084EXJ4_9BACT|nr:hypothetical protein [Ureaplasma diversum]KEZ22686.1 hypothetical protein UDIV_5400 [Ureaplasma diversum NCTC 246]